jgi:exosortase/archaeosortase family protein
MPTKNTSKINGSSSRSVLVYMLFALVIVFIVYYIPDYSLLERATANHAAILLNSMGIPARSKILYGRASLDNIQIAKDCTGIQVISVFLGLLIPLPNASLKKKTLTILIVSAILYSANLFRVVLEYWLLYFNILQYDLFHYPLGLLLGIVGVFFLTFVADRLLPEFRVFLFSISRRMVQN